MKNSTLLIPITFSVPEYCLFIILIGFILTIILYYLYKEFNTQTVTSLLYANRDLSVLAVTFGLISSHVTSITLLGVPVEIYMRGTQYWVSIISLLLVSIVASYIYLPVFYTLQLTSTFEYLEIRFSSHTRTLASLLFVASKLMILPIVPYVPILAFRRVLPQWSTLTVVIIVCSCSTLCSVAGLRSILSVALLSVTVACIAVVIPGGVGLIPIGIDELWHIACSGGRAVFNNKDINTAFWSVCIALSTNWLWKLGVSQSSVQKLLAVSSISKARVCIALSCVGVITFKLLSSFMGLVMYAWFSGCDPLLAGQIRRHEQLVPFFLSKLSDKFPGICGIFLMAIVSSTICTLASTINSVGGVVYEDLIRPWMPKITSERIACVTVQIINVIVGLYVILVLCTDNELERLMHIASGVTGVTGGILLGLFTLGIVFHRANCSGALSGALVSLLLCLWLLLGAENAIAKGKVFYDLKPLTATNCTARGNFTDAVKGIHTVTSTLGTTIKDKPLLTLFRISFTYCPFAGALTVILIGLPMSYLTGKPKSSTMNPDMFCPLSRRFLPKTRRKCISFKSVTTDSNTDVYIALDEALKHLKQVIDR